MTKEEARLSVMGAISMALKDSRLQQGFEIICKNLSDLEKENAELQDKLNNLASVAEVRLANWQKLEKENAELKARKGELAGKVASLERWLGEAKSIIKGLLEGCFGYHSKSVNYEAKARAEKFLKKELPK